MNKPLLVSALAPLLALIALSACSDAGVGAPVNLGVAGASCTRTPDCQAPLQCIQLVCTGLAADAAASDPGGLADVAGGGADVATGPDLPWVTEINPDADVSSWEFFTPDEGGLPDPGPTLADTGAGSWDSIFSSCEELGIGPSWAGSFLGSVDYDLNSNGLVYPEQGIMPVGGDLTFDIACIDSKLVVNGTMDGVATVVGQGDFPFVLHLSGYYSPSKKHLDAAIIDGKVTIYGVIEVFFEGAFSGDLQPDGTFLGSWSGVSTGTNQQIVTGTASGDGSWAASEAPPP